MSSTANVRALTRGLEILRALNLGDGNSARQLAEATGLPRPTVYRLLGTLCEAGYTTRDATGDRYRVTNRVRGLSDGFDDEAWVVEIAIPLMKDLCDDIVWPVSLATLDRNAMLVRVTTDSQSPLTLTHFATGDRLPVLGAATGRAYLAFCSEARCEAVLDVLARSHDPGNEMARDRPRVYRMLDDTRARGFAIRERGPFKTASLAVPIRAASGVVASLSMRYLDSAMELSESVERYVGPLRAAAAAIEDGLSKGAEAGLGDSGQT